MIKLDISKPETKGRLIPFQSEEDFNRIMELIKG
jgi:hypothetical protein